MPSSLWDEIKGTSCVASVGVTRNDLDPVLSCDLVLVAICV